MSLVLRCAPPLLPLIAAVAVCEVVGDRALVKWPNDIVLVRASGVSSERVDTGSGIKHGAGTNAGVGTKAGGSDPSDLAKLAGILAEGRPQEGWTVLGIGLNVAVRMDDLPAELREHRRHARRTAQRDRAHAHAPAGGAAAMAGRTDQAALAAYRTRDALRGREIAWSGGSGRAEGIDGEGRLVVALARGGQTSLDAGEVHLHT